MHTDPATVESGFCYRVEEREKKISQDELESGRWEKQDNEHGVDLTAGPQGWGECCRLTKGVWEVDKTALNQV